MIYPRAILLEAEHGWFSFTNLPPPLFLLLLPLWKEAWSPLATETWTKAVAPSPGILFVLLL